MSVKWQKVLSKRLKKEYEDRKDKNPNYSQKKFSDDLNISESMLTQLLKGERNITIDSAYAISKELNCSIDYLVREDSPRSNIPSSEEMKLSNISNVLKLSFESIYTITNILDDEEINALNELIHGFDFKAFLYQFNKYINYEKYYDSEFIKVDDFPINKEDWHLKVLSKKLANIKNNSSISEKKYKAIIKDLRKKVNQEKEYSINDCMWEEEYINDFSKLKQYESMLYECELSRNTLKSLTKNNDELLITTKENKNGKK